MATEEEFNALPDNALYFHLIFGTLMFHDPKNSPEHFAHYGISAVLVTEEQNLIGADLQRAEHALQMAFFQKTQETDFKILDITLQNVSFLAHCTKQKFFEQKEQEEIQPEDLAALMDSINQTGLAN